MDETEFIVGLMRENTDALGFIPRPTIVKQFVKPDRFIIQRNRFGLPIGYLLHGPVHVDGRIHIHQACIQLDRRNRGFGQAALEEFLGRANQKNARAVKLRCAWDLEANAFWEAAGFQRIATANGGTRRQRVILLYTLSIDKPAERFHQPES